MNEAEKTLLAVTSSQLQLSVAILHEGKTNFHEVSKEKGRRGEYLFPEIQHALKSMGIHVNDVQALIADVGPGSYTGLRTGISFVNGLAFARNIPVYGFSSLEMVLSAALEKEMSLPSEVVAAVYAGRQEVYVQTFVLNGASYVAEAPAGMSTLSHLLENKKKVCVLNHLIFEQTPFLKVNVSAMDLLNLYRTERISRSVKNAFAIPQYVRMMDIKIKHQALI